MLSRQERRILASIESHLAADAPGLAAQFRRLEFQPAGTHWSRARLMVLSSVAVLLMMSSVLGAATSVLLGGAFLAALGVMTAFALLYRSCMRRPGQGV